MLSRLREHLGGAGLIVAVVALVAALGGGAVAANGGGSNDGKATASAKGKQGKQGKQGKRGKPGPAGPAGPVGPAGPQGPKGDAGAPGANGADGAPGPAGPAGPAGKDGKAGAEGSPWTAGGVLPSEATQTGTVSGGVSENLAPIPVSFPIPLAEVPTAVYLAPGETEKEGCPGLLEGTPQADPGTLCVYMSTATEATFQGFFNPTLQLTPGVSKAGTTLLYTLPGDVPGYVMGSWAVTAE